MPININTAVAHAKKADGSYVQIDGFGLPDGTDGTLTQAGKAADAKATGDKISTIVNDVDVLKTNKFAKSDVINNLTTTDEGYALDARQGKVLNDKFKDVYPFGKGHEIKSESDINSVLTRGVYIIGSNNVASTIANIPSQFAGVLIVYIIGNADNMLDTRWLIGYQEYTDYYYNKYARAMETNSSGTAVSFGQWRKILQESDVVNNLTNTSTDKPLSANQGRLLREALNYFSLPEGSARVVSGSLNDLDKTGFYYSTNWDTSTTPNNSQYGYCVYIKSNYINQGYQLFFQLSEPKMWIRNNYNGTWSAWAKVTTTEECGIYRKNGANNSNSISFNVSDVVTEFGQAAVVANGSAANWTVEIHIASWSTRETWSCIASFSPIKNNSSVYCIPNIIASNMTGITFSVSGDTITASWGNIASYTSLKIVK